MSCLVLVSSMRVLNNQIEIIQHLQPVCIQIQKVIVSLDLACSFVVLSIELVTFLQVYNMNIMLHNPPIKQIMPLLISLFALLIPTRTKYILMSVTTNNLQINTQSTYTFTINRQYDPVNYAVISNPLAVTPNSTIAITFPSQFLTVYNSTSVPCTDSNGNDLGCTLNSATRKVIIANYYSTSATLSNTIITIIMPNIINAYKAGNSDNFFWEIRYPNGSIIDQGPATTTNYVSTSLTFLPGTFKSCSISAGGAYVRSAATLTFTINPNDQIPSGGQLAISIPAFWTSDPLAAAIISTSAPGCNAVSGLGSSSLSCSYDSNSNVVTVSGIASTVSDAFSLKISGILTPPTVGSGESITIYSQWSDGTYINSCTSLINGLVAVPFQSITLTSNDNTTVQSSFTATLKLTLSMPFYNQDTIVMILPSEMSSASVSSSNFATFTRTPGLNNTLTLSNFPSSPTVIAANNVITFTISNIKNSLSTAPMTLNVTFYRSSQLYQTQSISYTANAGILTSLSIIPDSNFVLTVGQTTINLVSDLYFPANSQISLTYPQSVTVGDLAAQSVIRCTLNSTVVSGVTYSVSNNQIKFFNIFSSNFAGSVSLIISQFANPFTTQPSTYTVSVTDQNNYAVMSGSTVVTANTKSLLSNSVSASSYTVLSTGAIYYLNLITNYAFTAISIIIPPEVTVGSSYSSTCAPRSFSSCSLIGRNLTFVGSLPAGSVQISWGYNTNPNSLEPTSSFQITTYYQGWSVQNSQGVITLTMNSTGSLVNTLVSPSSFKNSDIVSINLALNFPIMSPTGQLTMMVPSQLGLSSATCSGCTIVPPLIYYNYSGSGNLNVTISNVHNVASFKPVGSFTFRLSNSNNYASLQSSASSWTNSVSSSFVTTISGSNNYRGESNTFLFSMTSLPSSQSYVVITINSAFPALTAAPAGGSLIDSYNVKFNCNSSTCSVSLGLINPTSIGTYSFSLTTYSSQNFTVGTSTSNGWSFDCSTTDCRSCLANGSCLTCYNSSISQLYYFNSANNSCIRKCTTGSFQVNTTCTPCSSNCSECIATSFKCTACPSGYFLQPTSAVCIRTCLSGYFANSLNQLCDKCVSPCFTCQTTASNCLSCVTGTFLFGTQCLSTCPSPTYINNNTTSKCDPCNSNCLTCSGTISTCLSCDNTIGLYLQNSSCVTSCYNNYYLVNNVCTYCYAPCKLCNQAINVCASCFLNGSFPIYLNATCINSSQCTIGHYLNTSNSSCQTCSSACTQCQSSSICSSCASSYYLYGSQCISSCPNTTFAVNRTSGGICQSCNNCSTCSSSTVCTSCVSSQYLYLDVCYSVCPTGTYISGSICKVCNSNCTSCQNNSYCVSCITNMLLYLGVCYTTCPTKTYPNSTVAACLNCPSYCATCTSPTNCNTCISGYSLEDNQCVLTCSKGISYNQVCKPCDINCALCTGTTCGRCNDNYFLYNNTCVTKCPSNMLSIDSLTCVLCATLFVNCTSCNNTACLSCTYGQLLNGSCKPCDPGYYELSAKCISCPSSCVTCTSQTSCQTCATNNYLFQSSCSASCPRNMVPNGTLCTVCAPQCSVCNLTTLLCGVCNAGVYLYNNSCYAQCPSPLVVSYDFLSCVTQEVYYQQFSKVAKIIYFPFTIASVIFIIIGIILKCFHKEMHLQTALCSLLSLVQFLCWAVFLGFELNYWVNYHKTAFLGFVCSSVGMGCLLVLNFTHLRFFYKYAAIDSYFLRWYKSYSCTNCVLLGFSCALSFKFYRLIHSKFLGRNELSMVLSNANQLVPFTLLGIISLLFCSTPLGVGLALALYNSISQDQQFFIAFDTIVVTGIMIVLILMDMRHPDDYFIDEHQTKNLKRKIYQEDEIKFQKLGEGRSEDGSSGMIVNLEEDEGQMALPSTGHKFKSTFQHTNRKAGQMGSKANLKAEDQGLGQNQNEEDFQLQESVGDQCVFENQQTKGKWQPKQYDHHGYLIKYDQHNNPVRYDQYGYKVEIDQDGSHKKYNNAGQQVRIVDGKHLTYDQKGYLLVNGVPHDERGYQVREIGGEKQFFDERGFRVIGFGQDQKHIDEQGLIVKIDSKGNIRKYNADGWQVVEHEGKRLLKNEEGDFIRKNSQNQWEVYDPKDGFAFKKDPKTGEKIKYDEYGHRIVKDKFGQITRYDQQGNTVTILPGGTKVTYDSDGYLVETDSKGKVHRYDRDGYELVTDKNGKMRFIDKNGYTVQRDIYGRVTLYDQQGLIVIIDEETGVHRKFNQEGLQVVLNAEGKKILKDKRGKIVKELGQTYEKYDNQGNKIYLDENGYEVEYDEEGNVILYDKVGDRVEDSYHIVESDAEDNFQLQMESKPPKTKYRYKPPTAVDNQLQLQKMMTASQPFILDEEDEISQLREFHDYEPPQIQVDHQLDRMVNKERTQLLFQYQDNDGLNELKQQSFKQEEDELQEQDIIMQGLQTIDFFQEGRLVDKESNKQRQYDGQMNLQDNKDEPTLKNNNSLLPNDGLEDKQMGKQQLFDQNAVIRQIDEKEPAAKRLMTVNSEFEKGSALIDREKNKQNYFDSEAVVREIDQGEPDVLAIKKMQDKASAEARRRQKQRILEYPREQQNIQIKSVADVSLNERSFENQGVQPIQNKTEYDEVASLDQIEIPLGRGKRVNRSESKLPSNKKDTSTVYNYNTVEVAIKNQPQNLYDQDEQIESLQQEDWEQQNPTIFAARELIKNEDRSSNANTNIVFIEDKEENKDTLTEFVHQSDTKSKAKIVSRYADPNDLLSGGQHSIQQIEEQLFEQMREGGRDRRGFKLSGVPNPLVEYAKTIEANRNRKSLQQKMYLQNLYKRS